MKYRKCEICGLKSERKDGQKRYFMAQFPLNEARCKQWVKLTGKEDLAYVPIEKLHSLKYLCGKHFTLKDFNKRMTMLKRSAIPSVDLTRPPLSDDILLKFPLHIAKHTDPLVRILNDDHNYNCSFEEKIVKIPIIQTGKKRLTEEELLQHKSAPESTTNAEESIDAEESFSWQDDSAVVPSDGEEKTPAHLSEKKFSWQQESAVVPCDDDDDDDSMAWNSESGEKAPASPAYDYKKYRCDNCSRDILGFRYVCVQCAHVHLCGACEARQAHPHHYVLRIPGARPRGEVSAMLAKVRRAVLSDSLLQMAEDRPCDEIEVKEEPMPANSDEETESNDQEMDNSFEVEVPPVQLDACSTDNLQPPQVKLDNSCEVVVPPDQLDASSTDNTPPHVQQQTSEMKQSFTTQSSIMQNEPKKKLFLTIEPISTLHMTRKIVPIKPTVIQTSILECDAEKQKMLLKKLQGIDAYRENKIGPGKYGAKIQFSEATRKMMKLGHGCNIINKPKRRLSAKIINVDSGCIVKNRDTSQSPTNAIKTSDRTVSVKPRANKIISRLKQQLQSGSARVCLQRLSPADLRLASSQES